MTSLLGKRMDITSSPEEWEGLTCLLIGRGPYPSLGVGVRTLSFLWLVVIYICFGSYNLGLMLYDG